MQKLSNSRYLDGRVRFKQCICYERKCCTNSGLTMVGMKSPFCINCRKFSWTLHPSLILTLIHLFQNINPLGKSCFPSFSAHKTHLLAIWSNSEYSMITFHTLINTDQAQHPIAFRKEIRDRWNYSTEWDGCTAGTRTQSFISAPSSATPGNCLILLYRNLSKPSGTDWKRERWSS